MQTLKDNGVEVEYHNVPAEMGLSDSIFVHDPAIITDKGAIVCFLSSVYLSLSLFHSSHSLFHLLVINIVY